MHHEYTNYLFAHVDDWSGEDDYGFSFAQVDLDGLVYDVSDNAPESLQNATQQHVARVLGDHFGARHVILHWSYTGARAVHAMRSLEHARETLETLERDYQEWLDMSTEDV